jgi:hypothetical protein
MTDDFYRLLDVPEDASKPEIRAAFRHKVQEYHPDHNDDPRATAQFTALKMAYDTLGDDEERKAYDRLGHEEYVSERLDGLPDPNQWPSTGDQADESPDRVDRSVRENQTTGGGGDTAESRSQAGSVSGTSSRSAGAERRTTTDGGGTATRTGAGGPTGRRSHRSQPSRFERLLYHDVVLWLVGWRLLYFSVALYLSGLGAYAYEQQSALIAFLERVQTAGTDAGTLASVLDSREALVPISEFLLEGVPAVSPTAVLFAVGILCYPLVTFILVALTRRGPGWRPTFMYVLAALGPALGILTTILVGDSSMFTVAGDLLLYLVVPLGGFLTMLFSANLRPIILRRLGRD